MTEVGQLTASSSKDEQGDIELARGSRRNWRGVVKRFTQNRAAALGFILITLLILSAAFAEQVSPYDPIEIMPLDRFQPPSLAHPMGTDVFGRDIMSRVIHGGKISLSIGFIAVGIGGSIGTAVGVVGGFYGGAIDRLVSYAIDILLAFPGILLALTISASLGPGIENAMIAVGIASLPQYMRVARGSVISVKQEDYVEAARAVGGSNVQIIRRHILPNIVPPIIVLASLGVGTAILIGAAISFLGLGAQPPTPEWGAMLSGGRNYLRTAWWVTTFPGLFILLTVMSWNMIGDGLRYALDPRFIE